MISCADVARALNVSPATVNRATSRGAELSNLEQIQKKFWLFKSRRLLSVNSRKKINM
jgi:hypothetical protein